MYILEGAARGGGTFLDRRSNVPLLVSAVKSACCFAKSINFDHTVGMTIFTKIRYRLQQRVLHLFSYVMPWRTPDLLAGPGAVQELPAYIAAKGGKRVLLISDPGMKQLALYDGFVAQCEKEGLDCSVYAETKPDPTIEIVEAAVEQYYQNDCDCIVAFGGGSPMDCAKAAAARISRPKKQLARLGGLLKVRRRKLPLYAVPTTAGTGSEVTVAAVITDAAAKRKYAINDFCLIPDAAVLDPQLLVGLPPQLTAATGMDALCHAVEAYLNHSNTKATRQQARDAVVLINKNLLASFEDGKNLDYRNNMQLASFRAGQAFTRAYVGNIHAIAHTLGGFYHVPHGLANAVTMPIVLEYYGKAAWKRLAELADLIGLEAVGVADSGEADADSAQAKAQAFINWIRELNSKMGIPSSFDCIQKDDIPAMASNALREANPGYPVPRILSRADMYCLYEKIMA